jgi:Undecaprenyl-phosphate galactose phosphotransferase WbaP
MVRSQDALAKKQQEEIEEAESLHSSPASFDRAERQLTLLLHEVQDIPVDAVAPLALSSDAAAVERLMRAFIITDTTAMALGFLCAWFVAVVVNSIFLGRHDLITPTRSDDVMWLGQFTMLGAGLLLWFGHTGHYQVRMPFWMETKKIAEAACFAMLINCFLQFVYKGDFSRLWLVSCWGFSVLAIIGMRALWRAILRRRGMWEIPTLIVGNGLTAEEARAALQSEPGLGYNIVAQIHDLPSGLQAAGYSWAALCRARAARYVVIALDGEDFIKARPLLAQLMREHVPFSVSPPMHNLSVSGMTPQSFLGRDVMLLARNNGLDRPLPRMIKRSFDIVVASTALLLLSPVILALMLIVKLDGGVAFYRHKRIGLRGEVFSCLKFRSMVAKSDTALSRYLEKYPEARAEWMRDHKLREDPRITRIGRFLRRTSLDELPQLFNVLKGEMSIVGPRPIIVAETAKYDNDIAFYYRVRPGITGLWQVSGRNDVSYADRVRMDSWYVRNWSLWHDITIICKTFAVVIRQDGAY